MSVLSRTINYILYRIRRTTSPTNQKVLLECIMQIRESQVNMAIQLNKLKHKFSQSGMVETICVTDCELQKIERVLNALKKEGF